MGFLNRRKQQEPVLDTSDVLLALCNLDGDELALLAEMILDYQGGGVLTKPESVEILRREPSPQVHEQMTEIGQGMFDGFTSTGGSAISEGMAHAVFEGELRELLGIDKKRPLPAHRAISHGTVSAMAALANYGKVRDAAHVTRLGMCLYMNASDWEKSRARKK